MLSTEEAAKKHGITAGWIRRLIYRGEVPDAVFVPPRSWLVPEDWEPPKSKSLLTDEERAELDRAIVSGGRTAELARRFGVHPSHVSRRRRRLREISGKS